MQRTLALALEGQCHPSAASAAAKSPCALLMESEHRSFEVALRRCHVEVSWTCQSCLCEILFGSAMAAAWRKRLDA